MMRWGEEERLSGDYPPREAHCHTGKTWGGRKSNTIKEAIKVKKMKWTKISIPSIQRVHVLLIPIN